MAGQQYTVPIGIDPSEWIGGLEVMEDGLMKLTSQAKNASGAITESMTATNKAGDALVTKMNQGAKAAKDLSDAAKTAGVDLNKTFSADNIKTTGLEKVSQFVATLRDKTGKPFDFKFNVDQAAVKVLVDKITQAKSEMQGFNIILASARERLAGLTAGTPAFQELENQIKTADEFVKKLTMDVSGLKDEVSEPVPAGGALGDVPEQVEAATPKVKTLKQELKEMIEQLARMELEGQAGTAAFIELQKRAGNLSDQIGDTRQQVRELASDTKGLDAGIAAIRGLAGAFAVGQGALAAFGESNEEAAKAIQKVQGALAILQGVQEVANVLNKDSALMVYLKTFAVKTDTVATEVHTVAVEADAAATVAATTATRSFTAALLSNPLTAIIAVIGAAAFALYKYIDAEEKAARATKELNEVLGFQLTMLKEVQENIEINAKFELAQAELQRRIASIKKQIEIDATVSKLKAINDEIEMNNRALESDKRIGAERLKTLKTLMKDREFVEGEARQKIDDRIKRIEGQLGKDLFKIVQDAIKQETDLKRQAQITEVEIEQQKIEKQKILKDEEVNLRLALIKEKQGFVEVERSILQSGLNYANQIQDSRIASLRDGEQKEIKILEEQLKQKVQALELEKKVNLEKLTNERETLQVQLELADDNEKKIINTRLANLNREIQAQRKANEENTRLQVQLTEATELEKQKVIIKYQQKRRDFEHDLALKTLELQKESAAKTIAILNENASHELDLIQRSDATKLDKLRQYILVFQKLQKETAQATLEFKLKEIDIEKTSNENLLLERKHFFDKSRDAQALANYLLAKNQLDADQKKLEALKAAGKKEGDQEYENAKNAVLRSKAGVDETAKAVPKRSLFELIFPNDDKAQKNAESFMKALDQIGKAIDAFYALEIANYEKKIAAQKKVVSADDNAISKLQDQLREEESLRDRGYANNVDGIKKLLAEKNKQREEDIRKADEYQKKMQKIQKAQITAQTILQAVQLATAATNILLQSTAEGGAIGAVIGGLAVAAMIGAFIAEKKAAYDAVNAETSSFAGGGIIKGKSHAQGGQKYYAPDGTGGIMELEEGEHVTSKKQTEKYLPLLQAVNHDKLKDMDDGMILKLLDGLGVHLQTDRQHKEALSESREHTSHQINQISIEANGRTPKELVNIDQTLTLMANRSNEQVKTWEENGYIVTQKGNHIKKVRKHK